MATARKRPVKRSANQVEPMLPLDFSVLDQFEFIGGTGNYGSKQVCAMTALHLVVEIAKGTVTLAQATGQEPMPGRRVIRKQMFSDTPEGGIPVADHVACVSPTLNAIVIRRNDAMEDPEERKKWAMKILPKLVGTNLGARFENRLEKLTVDYAGEHLIDVALVKVKEWMKKKPLDGELLREAAEIIEDADEDEENPDLIPFYDKQIALILKAVKEEQRLRAGR